VPRKPSITFRPLILLHVVLQCLPSNNNLSSLIRDAAVRSRGVASVPLTTPRVAPVSNVAWSLCLSVCVCCMSHWLALPKRSNRSRCRLLWRQTRVAPKNHESKSPPPAAGRCAFFGGGEFCFVFFPALSTTQRCDWPGVAAFGCRVKFSR